MPLLYVQIHVTTHSEKKLNVPTHCTWITGLHVPDFKVVCFEVILSLSSILSAQKKASFQFSLHANRNAYPFLCGKVLVFSFLKLLFDRVARWVRRGCVQIRIKSSVVYLSFVLVLAQNWSDSTSVHKFPILLRFTEILLSFSTGDMCRRMERKICTGVPVRCESA